MYASATETLTKEERDARILEHLPQVNWIAIRIHEKLPPGVELDDLISAGVIGLVAAVDNYDPSHGASLRTYAEYKIRGAILDSIRGLDGIPSHKRKRVKQVQQAIGKVESELKRAATEEEIAAELGISIAEFQEWMVELRSVTLGSLNLVDEGEEFSLLKFISDDGEEAPDQLFERSELEKLVARGVERMPERERLVLSLYYKEELNLREIAEIMGLHLTRVAQLRAQGILRLRALLEHQWPSKGRVYSR
jgi:RNA polymerase sigma factor for flagellar operon FliA